MSKKVIVLALSLIVATAFMPGCSSDDNKADTVLTNGVVYTVDESQPWVDTVAIKDGKFVYVGNAEDGEFKDYVGKNTEVIDLNGQMVMPGMIDAHTHPESVALDSWSVTLPWTHDVDELLTFVKEYCEEHPVEEVPYFFGMYYPSDLFGDEGPTKELLDQYVSDRPVRLQDFSDHCCWVNSKALELMGVDKNTPDPEPGRRVFVRDTEGNPTGWVKEGATRNFEDTMYKAIGWYPPTEVDEDMWTTVVDYWHSVGIVGFMDALIEDESALKSLSSLDKQGKLNMYYSGLYCMSGYDDLENAIKTEKYYADTYGSENMKFDTIKYFLDGTNEIGTSAVLEPFSNDPTGTNYGFMNMDVEQLTDTMVKLNDAGLDFHVHLVGDRAFRAMCDATEAAQKICGDKWAIQVELTHCELVDPADMTRPAELGIIVNWSPHWTGGYFGDAATEWLGQERFDRMYDFTTMIKSGAIVDYGSDVVSKYESHRSNPFFGMQCAVTRIDPEFPMDTGVRSPLSACLSIKDLVEGYTLNSAIQFRIDEQAGTIADGKDASFCVLNKNVFDVPSDKISTVAPTAVMFKGNIVSGKL